MNAAQFETQHEFRLAGLLNFLLYWFQDTTLWTNGTGFMGSACLT